MRNTAVHKTCLIYHGTNMKTRAKALELEISQCVSMIHLASSVDGSGLLDWVEQNPEAPVFVLVDDIDVILRLAGMKAKIIIDADACGINKQAESDAWPETMVHIAGIASSFIRASEALRDRFERESKIAIPDLNASESLQAISTRIAVTVGSGYGNIVNVMPFISALANRFAARVDVIIDGFRPDAVQLFGDSEFVNVAYPHPEYAVGKGYDFYIRSANSTGYRPLLRTRNFFDQNEFFHFNRAGRFIPEWSLYFLGIGDFLGVGWPSPVLPSDFRDLGGSLFCRDRVADSFFNSSFERKDRLTIAVSNGIREGHWAKRQWPHMKELVGKLNTLGHEVWSMGSDVEYVEGAVNKTGQPLKDTIDDLKQVDLFIGHDSGLGHIADGLGVPGLHLFGATGAVKNAPIGYQSRVLTLFKSCSPCQFNVDFKRCNLPSCMTEMSPDYVLAEMDNLLTALTKGRAEMKRLKEKEFTSLIEHELRNTSGNGNDITLPDRKRERTDMLAHSVVHALDTAIELIKLAAYENALVYLDAASEQDPKDMRPFFLKAMIDFQTGQIEADTKDKVAAMGNRLGPVLAMAHSEDMFKAILCVVIWVCGADKLSNMLEESSSSLLDGKMPSWALIVLAKVRRHLEITSDPALAQSIVSSFREGIDENSDSALKIAFAKATPHEICAQVEHYSQKTETLDVEAAAFSVLKPEDRAAVVSMLGYEPSRGETVLICVGENPSGSNAVSLWGGVGKFALVLARLGLRPIILCATGRWKFMRVRNRGDVIWVQASPATMADFGKALVEHFNINLVLDFVGCAGSFNVQKGMTALHDLSALSEGFDWLSPNMFSADLTSSTSAFLPRLSSASEAGLAARKRWWDLYAALSLPVLVDRFEMVKRRYAPSILVVAASLEARQKLVRVAHQLPGINFVQIADDAPDLDLANLTVTNFGTFEEYKKIGAGYGAAWVLDVGALVPSAIMDDIRSRGLPLIINEEWVDTLPPTYQNNLCLIQDGRMAEALDNALAHMPKSIRPTEAVGLRNIM